MTDLERDPARATVLCARAGERLLAGLADLDDAAAGRDSLLPGWSVGHVLTHLARNADGHARRVAGALRGEDLGKYAGGGEQRRTEIEDGAGRGAEQLVADLRASQSRLMGLFERAVEDGWPHGDVTGGGPYPVTACPAHRLREVEMHHVDLGLGYTPADWPEEYVAWDLEVLLATVPERLTSVADRRGVLAWLAGRGEVGPHWSLEPWG